MSETDPNKLHDLKSALDGYQVYAPAQVDDLVTLYLGGADRDQLDPILDACVAVYNEQLDEDGQVDFKGKARPTGWKMKLRRMPSTSLPTFCRKLWEANLNETQIRPEPFLTTAQTRVAPFWKRNDRRAGAAPVDDAGPVSQPRIAIEFILHYSG